MTYSWSSNGVVIVYIIWHYKVSAGIYTRKVAYNVVMAHQIWFLGSPTERGEYPEGRSPCHGCWWYDATFPTLNYGLINRNHLNTYWCNPSTIAYMLFFYIYYNIYRGMQKYNSYLFTFDSELILMITRTMVSK